jgi:hypothetical protein
MRWEIVDRDWCYRCGHEEYVMSNIRQRSEGMNEEQKAICKEFVLCLWTKKAASARDLLSRNEVK